MSRIGKMLPPGIKRPIVNFTNWCGRCYGKVFMAATAGKIYFPERLLLQWHYKVFQHEKLNLKNPQLYSEKLQWLKYYYHNPKLTMLVDKYNVREFVKEKVGEDALIPIYGVYDTFEEINFDELPESFVLKCTHDSGSVVICKNKNTFDFDKAKEKLNNCLHINQFYKSGEWPYKNVKPRIICEKYYEIFNTDETTDFRLFCFDGEPKFIMICTNLLEYKNLTTDFYDLEWNKMDLKRNDHPNSNLVHEKPLSLDKMIEYAKILSEGLPHVRVDFNCIGEKVFFGEMTFFPTGGRNKFIPDKYNKILGDMIKLPPKMR